MYVCMYVCIYVCLRHSIIHQKSRSDALRKTSTVLPLIQSLYIYEEGTFEGSRRTYIHTYIHTYTHTSIQKTQHTYTNTYKRVNIHTQPIYIHAYIQHMYILNMDRKLTYVRTI